MLAEIDSSNANILVENENITDVIDYGGGNSQTYAVETLDSKQPASVSQMSYKVSD